MLKKIRLGHKMILVLCVIFLASYTILDIVVLKSTYNYSHEQAKTIAQMTSKDNAEKVVLHFETIETVGISVVNQMEAMVKENHTSREVVLSTMRNILNSHNDIFGIAVTYEPNMFDGKDKLYINREGANSKGQFMPYVTRVDSGKFTTELSFNPLYNYNQNLWYTMPEKTHKIYLTEPTTYPVHGKDVTMASVVVPIMRDGRFVGVVSIDTTIDYLQTEILKVRPMGGFSQIISSEGVFVANGADSISVLKDISNEKEWEPILKRTSKGQEFTEVGYSAEANQEVLRVFSSINLPGTDQYWTYVSIIPYSHIFASYNDAFKLMVSVGLVLIAFIIYFNYTIIIKDV